MSRRHAGGLRRAVARLLSPLRRARLERELDDELGAHLEAAEAEARAAGLSREEARRAARRHVGWLDQIKEAHRDARGVPWLDHLVRDVRYGLAGLRRDRTFALVAIGVLGLGIGAATAMYGVVDGVLLKPLPFREPNRLVSVMEAPTPSTRNSITTLNFLDWRRMSTVFDSLAASVPVHANVMVGGDPARMTGMMVTADFFRVFGVDAHVGRVFARGEDDPGAPPVVVLSHAAWRNRLGADPAIVGRDLRLDGRDHVVVGVLPPGPFDRDMAGRGPADFWKPLVFQPAHHTRSAHWLTAVGRLRPGVGLAEARAQMVAIAESLRDVNPAWKRDWSVAVDPYDPRADSDIIRRSVLVAFGAVVLVLLIACANVANLLLARGASRRQELAMRAALGGSRGRLISQLLTESLLLSGLGGAAGLGLASLALGGLAPSLIDILPFASAVTLDARALVFAAGVTLGVTLLVGLLPALRASRGSLAPALGESARGSSRAFDRLRRTLVVAEVSLSLVLLCGSLLMARSLANLDAADLGVRVDGVIGISMELPEQTYPDPERAVQLFQSALDAVSSVRGVDQVSLTSDLPLEGVGGAEFVMREGREERVLALLKRVGPGYVETLDISLIAGRGITDRDGSAAQPVLVINEVLARELEGVLGFENPIGQRVQIAVPNYVPVDGRRVDLEIVGVIGNERIGDIDEPPPAVAYVPLVQVPGRQVSLVVRTSVPPAGVVAPIRDAMRRVDPELSLADVRTMDEVKRRSLAGVRAPASAIGAFATAAVLLTVLGLYGVLAHLVALRRREIGIRTALGARSVDVITQVLGQGARLIGLGLAVGLAGVIALTRMLDGLLFGVSALDPVAVIGACMAMAVVSLVAVAGPAARAARLDPSRALREDG